MAPSEVPSQAFVIPAAAAPSIKAVKRELADAREGTGDSVPSDLRYGVPVRVFVLKQRATAGTLQDLIDPTRVMFYYPLLSSRGLEGELAYGPWDDSPLYEEIGDIGASRPVSESVSADFKRYIAELPSVGASPVTGILRPGVAYSVAVALTATSAVGVFHDSGLVGCRSPSAPLPPYVPTGVVFRDGELVRQVMIAAARR